MKLNRLFAGPLIGLAICALLASCAQTLHGGPLEWDQHSRQGKVVELLTSDAARAATMGCPAPEPLDASPHVYVRVRYRGVRLHHVVVATVPDEVDVKIGDKVEVSPGDCAAGRLARVERRVTDSVLK